MKRSSRQGGKEKSLIYDSNKHHQEKQKNLKSFSQVIWKSSEQIVHLQGSNHINTKRRPYYHLQSNNFLLSIINTHPTKSYKKFTYKALNQPETIDPLEQDNYSINSDINPNEINPITIFPHSTILTKYCDSCTEEIDEDTHNEIQAKLNHYSHKTLTHKDHHELFKEAQIDYCSVLTDYYTKKNHQELPMQKINKISQEIEEINRYIHEIASSKQIIQGLEMKIRQENNSFKMRLKHKSTLGNLPNGVVLLNEFNKIKERHICKVNQFNHIMRRLNQEINERKQRK